MAQRGSVVIYRNFMDAISGVPERSYKRIMNAVLHYAMDGVEPKLEGLELAVFCMAKTQIDVNNKKFANGQKGGAPENNQNASKNNQDENEDNQETTKNNQKQPNDNQTETKNNLPRARMRNEKCEMRNEG